MWNTTLLSLLDDTLRNNSALSLKVIFLVNSTTFLNEMFDPFEFPTLQPTPTCKPSAQPTFYPSFHPTSCKPTRHPSFHPSPFPTFGPTNFPSTYPTNFPTYNPTFPPTVMPTYEPTPQPKALPTATPTTAASSFLALSVPASLLVCIAFVIYGLFLKNYKETHHHLPYFLPHESAIACILGLVMGGIIKGTTVYEVIFSQDLFFYLVLPPIIFNAGYSLKRKRFFRHGVLITVFGILGTLLNFSMTAVAGYYYAHLVNPDHRLVLSWPQAFLLGEIELT